MPHTSVMQTLSRDHGNVALLLTYLDRQATLSRQGEACDLNMCFVVMDYMVSYPDIFHHPREDQIFEALRTRTHAVDDVIADLESQHRVLKQQGLDIRARLKKLVEENSEMDAVTTAMLVDYVVEHREHMNLEETRVFPLARILLDRKDLERIDERLKWREDQLFGPVAEKVANLLVETLSRE